MKSCVREKGLLFREGVIIFFILALLVALFLITHALGRPQNIEGGDSVSQLRIEARDT